MPIEAPQIGRIADQKIRSFIGELGGSRHTHLSHGEMGNRDIVLVEGEFPYILKKKSAVPDRKSMDIARLGRQDYEVGILNLLIWHIDSAPVAIPTVIEEDRLSAVFAAEYIPGKTFTDMEVAAMKPSEKQALGTKLAQYVHWFAQAVPLDNPEFRRLYDSDARPYDKRSALLDVNEFTITSHDLENVGQYTLADVREEQVREYVRLSNAGRITKRTIVGHNDLKPSNFVFNPDSNGDMTLTSVIDYEQAIPTTPEQEFRRTPQMGEEVLHASINEYACLTGVVLDAEIIRFWDRVHFVNYASGYAMRSFPGDSREILTRELQRVYPEHDWREVSGEITYPSNV